MNSQVYNTGHNQTYGEDTESGVLAGITEP